VGGRGVARPFHCKLATGPSSSAVLLIALFSVIKCQPDAEAHKARWWDEQHEDALADGSLPVLGGRRSRAETHRAALAERRRRPHPEEQRFFVMAVLLCNPLRYGDLIWFHNSRAPRGSSPTSDRPTEK